MGDRVRFDSHGTIGKYNRNPNLLRRRHVQGPKQRHRHQQEHEVDKDITEAKNVFHPRRIYHAHRRGCQTFLGEIGDYWLAGEADQENAQERPNRHDGGHYPGGVAEFRDHFENAIEKDQDGEFGKGAGDHIE